MTILEAERVVKRFRGVTALNGLTLKVEQGETVGIIGPNGAGKTTLFNVISGVYRPENGRLTLKGENVTGLRPDEICARGLGRTFQIVQPFAQLSVLDNIATGCLFGMNRKNKPRSLAEARLKAREYLGLGHLEGKGHLLAGSLTLSERKRLEMTRALATGSDVILLDEVMAGLTPSEAEKMASTIREFRESLHLTVLLIEHNVRLVMGLSHRIVVLDYGEMIACGKPEEIASNPDVIKAYLGEEWVRRHYLA